MPGTSGQASTPTDGKPTNATAWVIAPGAKIPYDLGTLINFLPVRHDQYEINIDRNGLVLT